MRNTPPVEILPKAPAASDPRAQMRTIATVLDSAFVIPGTNIRFGFDALIGLVPGSGDVLGAALSSYIILVAARAGTPRLTLARMVGNVVVEAIVGFVPVIGDLFDVVWKANLKNVKLFEGAKLENLSQEEGDRRLASTISMLLITGIILGMTLLAISISVFAAMLRFIGGLF